MGTLRHSWVRPLWMVSLMTVAVGACSSSSPPRSVPTSLTSTTTGAPTSSRPAASSTAGTLATRSCGSVAFTPTASSQGAFQIVTKGADCVTARAVAAAAKGRNGAPYRSGEFDCPQGSPSPPSGMAYWTYRCTQGSVQVTFNEQG